MATWDVDKTAGRRLINRKVEKNDLYIVLLPNCILPMQFLNAKKSIYRKVLLDKYEYLHSFCNLSRIHELVHLTHCLCSGSHCFGEFNISSHSLSGATSCLYLLTFLIWRAINTTSIINFFIFLSLSVVY